MEILLSFVVGCLVAGGTYLLLRPHLLRLFFGLVLLSNAVNLLIFTMGRLTRGTPPLIVEGQTVPTEAIANPLSQAIVLTSIVISFGIASFMLVLVYVAEKVLNTVHSDDLKVAEQIAETDTDED